MQREKLLAVLEVVGVALGRDGLMPQLSHLWFDSTSVTAFDDNIAVMAPCPLELQGGVKGIMLLGVLGKTRINADVAVSVKGETATIKIGKRTTVKLPVMPLDQWQWAMPGDDDSALVKADPKQLKIALEYCLKSVGQNLTFPEWQGVTFSAIKEGGKDAMLVCSGYPQVIVRTVVPLQRKPKFKRVILPEKFCAQALKHIGSKGVQLELHNHQGLLRHPDMRIFGRALSTGSETLEMGEIAEKAHSRASNFIPMPPRLENLLERAGLFEGEHNNLQIGMVRDGKQCRMRAVSNGSGAELVDLTTPFDAGDVEPVEVLTNARHLVNGATLQEISIDAERIVMRADLSDVNVVQVVSVGDT